MLNLKSDTAERWLAQVDDDLPSVLIDHAHCEKKAAGTAMNLMFAYPGRADLCRQLAEIVVEELDHFRLVLDLLERAKFNSAARSRATTAGNWASSSARRTRAARSIGCWWQR